LPAIKKIAPTKKAIYRHAQVTPATQHLLLFYLMIAADISDRDHYLKEHKNYQNKHMYSGDFLQKARSKTESNNRWQSSLKSI
jgi:hypothetical protein